MSEIGLIQIIEGALLAAGKPMTVVQLAALFEDNEKPENTAIREALKTVAERCEDRGFELVEVASGFRFQVRQSLSTWIARLSQERPQRYSRALLETLALMAYRQPITRGEIEEIRGVAVSTNIIKTLHEREWIRVVGHRDVPGRPAMYATTKLFLDYFNLNSLDQLPALAEIRDLETLNAELGFTDPLPAETAADGTPELTVVGGTEHTPGLEIVGDDSEGVSLAEAADDLEARAPVIAGDGLAEDAESSASEEPSGMAEPSAYEEPSANEEPSADEAFLGEEEPSSYKQPAAELDDTAADTAPDESTQSEASADDGDDIDLSHPENQA
jgi:segregation and condensation protein B